MENQDSPGVLGKPDADKIVQTQCFFLLRARDPKIRWQMVVGWNVPRQVHRALGEGARAIGMHMIQDMMAKNAWTARAHRLKSVTVTHPDAGVIRPE